MYSISLVVVVVLTAGVVSSQSDCPSITEATLESVITKYVPSGDHRETPTVDVLNFRPVCLAYSQERDRYRYVSVVVEYTCTGNANCPSGTAVEQFDSQCNSGTWSHSVQGDTDNTRTENPTANFSTTTREDCAFCFSSLTAYEFGITTDTITHCIGCHSSCDEGLRRCYGRQDTQCCQYYNATTCVDTCPSPYILDDEYICDCPSGYTGYNCSQPTVPNDTSTVISMISGTVSTPMESVPAPTDLSKSTNSDTSCFCDKRILLAMSVVLAVLVVLLTAALVVSLIVVYRLQSSRRESVSTTIPVHENMAYSELKVKAKASESEVASSPQYDEITVKN